MYTLTLDPKYAEEFVEKTSGKVEEFKVNRRYSPPRGYHGMETSTHSVLQDH